jgi:hypothetical protein
MSPERELSSRDEVTEPERTKLSPPEGQPPAPDTAPETLPTSQPVELPPIDDSRLELTEEEKREQEIHRRLAIKGRVLYDDKPRLEELSSQNLSSKFAAERQALLSEISRLADAKKEMDVRRESLGGNNEALVVWGRENEQWLDDISQLGTKIQAFLKAAETNDESQYPYFESPPSPEPAEPGEELQGQPPVEPPPSPPPPPDASAAAVVEPAPEPPAPPPPAPTAPALPAEPPAPSSEPEPPEPAADTPEPESPKRKLAQHQQAVQEKITNGNLNEAQKEQGRALLKRIIEIGESPGLPSPNEITPLCAEIDTFLERLPSILQADSDYGTSLPLKKPEAAEPAESAEQAAPDVAFSRRERKAAGAVRHRRERTEDFVDSHLATYLETTASRAAGKFSVKDRVSEWWSRTRLEREISKIQENITVAKERLDKYETRFSNLQASLERLEQLSATRPKLQAKLEALRERLAPQMGELTNLIVIQEKILQENGTSLKTLAGGMGQALPANEAAGISADIPAIPGPSEENESGATLDAYMKDYSDRLGQLFGTTGPELPARYRDKHSAIGSFFEWLLGLEGKERPTQEGAT